jgi:hypothetical protein
MINRLAHNDFQLADWHCNNDKQSHWEGAIEGVQASSCDMIYVSLLCVYITKEQAPESSTAVASVLLPYVSQHAVQHAPLILCTSRISLF